MDLENELVYVHMDQGILADGVLCSEFHDKEDSSSAGLQLSVRGGRNAETDLLRPSLGARSGLQSNDLLTNTTIERQTSMWQQVAL
jgi:hypothetical protein